METVRPHFKLQVGSYFYDRNSVTCSSEFRDPKQSRESTERALQHSVEFRSLPKAQRTVRWEKNSKCDRRSFSQVGFGKLCCLWLPDISPEKAPASHLPSKLSEKKKKELNLKNSISDLHPLLPLCICVLDQFCD